MERVISSWSKVYNGFKFRLLSNGIDLILERLDGAGVLARCAADSIMASEWKRSAGFQGD